MHQPTPRGPAVRSFQKSADAGAGYTSGGPSGAASDFECADGVSGEAVDLDVIVDLRHQLFELHPAAAEFAGCSAGNFRSSSS